MGQRHTFTDSDIASRHSSHQFLHLFKLNMHIMVLKRMHIMILEHMHIMILERMQVFLWDFRDYLLFFLNFIRKKNSKTIQRNLFSRLKSSKTDS